MNMQHAELYRDRRRQRRQGNGCAPGADGLPGGVVQPYARAMSRAIKARGGIDLESFLGRPTRVWPPDGRHLRHRAGGQVVRGDHGRRAFLGACRPGGGHGPAPARRAGRSFCIPGARCGAIEVAAVLARCNCQADVTVAEAGTFIYASRSDGPAQARIFGIKEAVPLAALPAVCTPMVLNLLRAGLSPVCGRHQRAQHRARQHGCDLPPGPHPAECRAHRIDQRRLPVLHRRRHALGRARAGGAGPRAGDRGLGTRHSRADGGRVAGDGLQRLRRGPERDDPQPAGLLWHQGTADAWGIATSPRMCP